MKRNLDPRTKLLILVLINVIVFVTPDLKTEWLCMSVIAAILVYMGAYRQAMRGVFTYVGMMAALWLCAHFPGILSGIVSMMVLCFRKVVPTVMFASGLIATTKVSELICALQKLHVPKSIMIPFAVTLRFFPTAKEEFACIKDAMRLRGIGLNARNLLTRPLTVMECVLIPMMLRSASIAEELSAAAVTRGIDCDHARSSLCELSLKWGDAAGTLALGALSFVALVGGVGI